MIAAFLLFAFSSLTFFPFPPACFAQRSDVDLLIQRIESHYGRMRGLSADFEQVASAPGVRERRERGTLVLRRPRLMRWEYESGKLFIVNNREVWFYVPADREATHAQVDEVSDTRFPFLFLLGNMNLRRISRSITLADGDQQSGTRSLRIIPRDANGLREVILETYSDGRISKVKMTDESGARSEISLTNLRENSIAPLTAFQFQPPAGVTVRTMR
ncbi:MAG TPA: outer membrane lipoprotein carrier protein LolA [Pyrinomonadaceae bacterium]|nr:outer membrane lipoprotein carrier protein LolA [Pyrinomonadaceae bacterium]